MARLGLRRNEALGLSWDDVDLEHEQLDLRFQVGRVPDPGRPGRTILVRRALKTMSSRRRLRLAGSLAELLQAHRDRSTPVDSSARLVVSLRGGRLADPDAFTHWLTRIGADAGLEVSPHRLRHSAATLMLNEGDSLEAVSKVLGHSDTRVTSVYARVLDRTSAAALDLLAAQLDEAAASSRGRA
jgi:integrase